MVDRCAYGRLLLGDCALSGGVLNVRAGVSKSGLYRLIAIELCFIYANAKDIVCSTHEEIFFAPYFITRNWIVIEYLGASLNRVW